MTRKTDDPSFDPTPDHALALPDVTPRSEDALALVIAWTRTEPARLGECAFIPPMPSILGRGGPRPDDAAARVEFVAMRPSGNTARPPLAAPNLSRRHLRLRPEHHRIAFEREGKGPVILDGVASDAGQLSPGSTLLLSNEVLLLCERRPTSLPDSPLARSPDFTFGRADRHHLAGESAAAWRLREQIRFASGSAAPLIIQGPAGAGKDLVARAVHEASAWRDRPLLTVAGATLGRADLEALQSRGDAPMVLIDELGDVPADMQPLLARYIALTNGRPLPRARVVAMSTIGAGQNERPRQELTSRFVLTIRLPGLDERVADIPLIARAILTDIAAGQPEVGARFFEGWDPDTGAGEPRLSPALVDRLLRHPWQAHARELTTLLWASMTTARSAWLDLTPEVLSQLDETSATYADPAALDADTVRRALDDAAGRVAVAARALGLKNRWVLYRLMEKLDITT